MPLTWEQKVIAMQALLSGISAVNLYMRKEGEWYVHLNGIDVKKGSMLHSPGENGETPQAAVENTWDKLTNMEEGAYLVKVSELPRRRYWWNGFMWVWKLETEGENASSRD